ncbi:EamA family transporter [Bacillus tianshenii]|uniref:EamA family transporter n=1 Tax=Sutcliffiella tianshenii TaxID=1463404 RepID=UPI001CD40C90|nr:EamA family transporter [Bacillus tianshenii]MCA1320497.1 EamA family transporter [Bacillus tianshenii]
MAAINFLILLFMTLLGALGGLYLKKASSFFNGLNSKFLVLLFIGGGLYFLGALLNIYLLTKLPYTIVFPLTSITYFWTLLLSKLQLKEKITIRKMVGVSLILIGCILLVL